MLEFIAAAKHGVCAVRDGRAGTADAADAADRD
jgi:hypothetical protein